MRRRLFWYLVIFHLLAAAAAVPGFAIALNWSSQRVLMWVSVPLAGPPLVLAWEVGQHLTRLGLPRSVAFLGANWIAPLGCVAYYAALAALFLPVALGPAHRFRRHGRLVLAWRIVVALVVFAHAALTLYAITLMT